jgi:hypothetical protein
MKQSSLDALAMTGIELEELQDVGAALQREAPKDSRVCICGHSMNKHTAVNGYVLCKPSRMACPLQSGETCSNLFKCKTLYEKKSRVRDFPCFDARASKSNRTGC